MSDSFNKNLISTKLASELCGYHPDYIGRLCRSGKIKSVQFGRGWLVDKESLLEFCKKQEKKQKENAVNLSRVREQEYKAAQTKQGTSKSAPRKRVRHNQVSSGFRENAIAGIVALSMGIVSLYSLQGGVVNALAVKTLNLAYSSSEGFKYLAENIPQLPDVKTITQANKSQKYPVYFFDQKIAFPEVARNENSNDSLAVSVIRPTYFENSNQSTFLFNTTEFENVIGSISHPEASLAYVGEHAPEIYTGVGEDLHNEIVNGLAFYKTNISYVANAWIAGGEPSRAALLRAANSTVDIEASTGESIATTAHAVTAGYANGLETFVANTPEVPKVAVVGVYNLGTYLAAGTSLIPGTAADLYEQGIVAWVHASYGVADASEKALLAVGTSINAMGENLRTTHMALMSGAGTLAYSNIETVVSTTENVQKKLAAAFPDTTLATTASFEEKSQEAAVARVQSNISFEAATNAIAANVLTSITHSIYGSGEHVALYTYETINNLFYRGLSTVAYLFRPSVAIILPSEGPSPAGTSSSYSIISQTPVQNIVNQITIQGVTYDVLNQKLAELRRTVSSDIYNSIDQNRSHNTGGGGGTGSVTSVDISGGTTGFTFAGGPITSTGTFTMSGVLAIANGGTGTGTAPTYGQLLVGDGLGGYSLVATSSLGIGAGSGSPGGANTQVQFNNSGVFAGDADFTFDNATDLLSVTNLLTTHATSTDFSITGLVSKLLRTDANGRVSEVTIGSGLTFNGTTLATSGGGITAIGPTGQTQTGGTITIATTTSSFNGLTTGLTVVGAGNTLTFQPSLIGTLDNAGLTNSTVSFGGVTLSLGGTDATPAFNLTDATNLPIDAGTTGTLPVNRGGTGATSLNDLITLGTHTTGAYLATLSGTANQITVSGSGGESATPSISIPSQFNIQNASTTNFSANTLAVGGTGTTTISSSGALITPSLTIGSLTGFLKATAGVVSTATIDLVNDVGSSILAVTNGGTGWANLQANTVLLGNGTGRIATTSTGTNGQVLALVGGVPTWISTTTAGTGLSYSAGSFNVNTSQNIAQLSNLTTNGFVKTSGGNGTLSIDTNTYLTSIGPAGSLQTGPAVTLATSSTAFNGLTASTTITASGNTITFANTLAGALTNAGLQNSTVSYGGVTLSLGGSDATPAFDLTDATGLPISTGVSGLGAGVATFLATPSSANLATAVTGETGSGALVFGTSPTISGATLTGITSISNASTSAFSANTLAVGGTGTTTISSTGALVTPSLTIDSLTGFLKATAGAVSTATIDLANDVGSSILAVTNGGTGWSNLQANTVLLGNGTGKIATTSAGTNGQVLALSNGVPTWVATTTLATISGTLSQDKGGTGLTTYTSGDILYADGSGTLTTLGIGTAGQVLKVTGGLPQWGLDISTGGGGGAGAWATTTDDLAIYPSDTSDVVIVGNNATSTLTSIFEVQGRSYFSNTIGIATTTPSSAFKLSVQGNGLFSGNVSLANLTATGTANIGALTIGGDTFTDLTGSGLVDSGGVLTVDTSGDWTGTFDGQEGSFYLDRANHTGTQLASTISDFDSAVNSYINASTTIPKTYTANSFTEKQTFTYASSTGISSSYASSTNAFFGNLSVGSLTGFLKATAGVVSTATIDLANDVGSSILAATNGGTGWANVQSGALLYGNGTGRLATTSQGTGGQVLAWLNGVPTWTSTSSINNGVSSIQQTYGSAQTGAITFATSSASTFNGLTIANSITNSSGTFTFSPNTITGTLDNAGLTNSTISGIALGANLADLSATDSTLTFSGAYNGSTARTVGINLNNPNSWTALQSFANASSTLFSNTGTAYFGGTATTTITSTGFIGISTSTPWGMLSINSPAAGGTTPIFTVASTSGTAFIIDQTGRVGIGTTSPNTNASLAVTGAGYFTGNLSAIGGTLQLNAANQTSATINLGSQAGLTRSGNNFSVGNTATNNQLIFNASGGEGGRFTGTGLGIGSTTPYAKLAVSGFSAGAGIVVDALSAFTGNLLDLKLASTTKFAIDQAGGITTSLGTGLVKSTSGVLSLASAGTDYLTSAITAIGPAGQTQTGPTVTFATSSTAFNGLTASTTITGAGNTLTFTNTLSGALTNAGLANSTVSYGGVTLSLGGTDATPAFDLTDATGLPISTGVAGLGSGVAAFLATPSSANLATAVTGETGSGALVFGTSPTISGATLTGITSISNASTSAFSANTLAVGGTATTTISSAGALATPSLSIGSLTGFLKATAGAVSTATIDLANDVGSSILAVTNGGTGWANLQANTVLLGNGTGKIATTSAGTNGQVLALVAGVPTWTSTTTAGTGLTYSAGAFNVNTTQNIAKLSNLTSNGFVKTSGGDGTLSIDTNTYLTSALTSIGPAGSLQTGPAVTLATSSTAFNGLTASTTITASGNTITFANTLAGALTNAGLANSTVSYGGVTLSLGGSDATPAFDLTDATGLPIATGVSGLGSGVAAFLATPSSANLAAAVTGETGSGALVFGTSPTISGATLTGITSISNASTSAFSANTLAVGGTATTTISSAGALATPSLSIGSLTGFLKATAGAVSTATVDLANDVGASILAVTNGGTGWANLQANTVLLGNGTGKIATTSAGTNGQVLALVGGVPTWVATTTLSTISGTLGVANGGTGSTTLTGILRGNGTGQVSSVVIGSGLTFDGTTLATAGAGITAIGPTGQTQTGGTITFATSTSAFNGLTPNLVITGAGDTITYTSSLSGTLNNAGLTNSTVSYGGVTLSLGGTDATPAFDLTDATGLPISTGVSGLGAGVATFLGTPSSANLAAAVTGETGSGALVFGTSPTISGATLTGITSISNASTSAFSANTLAVGGTGTTTIDTAGALATPSLSIGSLTGFLKATAGAVSTATIDLANDVGSSILAVTNGGTGWANLQANTVLLGNGTGKIATTSAGTNGQVLALVAGVPTWTATTTAGTGLTYSAGAFNVNTTQNIAKLSNLTSNGFVKTSGGDGTLIVDTSTYLTSALTSIGPAGSLQTGPAVTLATSSTAFNGLTASTTITASGNTITFANTLAGLLGVAGGGTGAATFTNNRLLTGNGTSALVDEANLTFDGSLLTVTGNASTTQLTTTGNTYLATAGGNVGIGTTTPAAPLTIESGADAPIFTVLGTGLVGNPAFELDIPLSTSVNDGKGFSIRAIGEDFARAMFYSDGKYGVGDGTGVRDTYLSRSAANTFRISSNGTTGSANLVVNGTASSTALITSGAVTFQSLTGILASNGTSGVAARTLTGNAQVAISNGTGAAGNPTFSINADSIGDSQLAFDTGQNLTTASSPTFAGLTLSAPLSVANGGTGWANIQAGAIPYGNGTTRVSTTTQGTGGQVLAWLNGIPTWIATTTAGTGLTFSAGAFNVNTTQNIAKLSNLTSNGFVKTSGGDGTLSIDTNTYLTSALTSIGPAGSLQTGPAVTLATSSTAFNGLTASTTITASGNTITFANTLAGALTNAGLANSTVSYGGVTLSLGGTDATPAFDLTDATGLPISTGVSGLGAGVATFLATPSSANLAAAVTGETGSGALVFGTSPTISGGILTGITSISNASTSAFSANTLAVGGTATTTISTAGALATPSLSIGSLTGFLKATAGVVSTATIDLANDVGSSILAVVNGGTGWANIQANTVLIGNGTSRLATTTAGTNGQVLALVAGVPTWTSTTTAGTGLTYSAGSFNVNTSQNIATLSNLTSNGFVKTSGGTGALSIDTNTYLTSALTSIGPAGALQTGPAITIATSSTAFNGLTASTTVTASGNTITFANTLAGMLGVAGGGTGAATFTNNRLLTGNGTSAIVDEANLTFDGSLLTVTGNASTTQLTTTASTYLATAGGSVGIGTTSPATKLDVNGYALIEGINRLVFSQYTSTTDHGPWIAYSSTNNSLDIVSGFNTSNGLGSNGIRFGTPSGATWNVRATLDGNGNLGIGTTTPSKPLDVYSNTLGNSAVFYGNNGTGGAAVALGGNASAGSIQGYTNDSAVATANLVLQTSGGNVGIGTTSPGEKLTVRGNVALDVNNAGYYFLSTTGVEDGAVRLNTSNELQLESGVGNAIRFFDNNAVNERLTILSGGNVGIGTSTPYAKLSVVGQAVAAYFTATTTTASTFPYASTTALSISGLSNGRVPYAGTGGILQDSANLTFDGTTLSANTLSLTNALPIASGGTATTTFYNGGVLFYNSTLGTISQGTTNADFFYDRTNKRLGLGTASPAATLSLYQTAAFQPQVLAWNDANDNTSAIWNSRKSRSGGPVVADDTIGSFTFQAYDADSVARNAASIAAAIDTIGGTGTGITSARITFSTMNSSGVTSEKVRIAGDGQVGIASSTPWARLSLPSFGVNSQPVFGIGSAGAPRFFVDNSGNVTVGTTTASAEMTIWQTSASREIFAVTTSASSSALVVNSTGFVGVGSTTPWANLSVNSSAGTPQFAIGSSTTQFIVDKNGNVGIGSTTPYARLGVSGFTTGIPGIVADAISGFTGNLLDLKVASTTKFSVDQAGALTLGTALTEANGGTGLTALGTGVATWLGTPSSANFAAAVTGETGSGAVVFDTSPQFTTDIRTPLIYGGTAAGSTLTLRATNAAGIGAEAIIFGVGNNGAVEAGRITGPGMWGIGTTTPRFSVQIASSTGPQLALSDGTATSNAWTFRSISNSLYIGTSSPSTFATSTVPALSFNANGIANFALCPTILGTACQGSGGIVRATSPTITTPTITTSATGPLFIGGTGAGSTLSLRSTSGTGTSDAIIFQVGTNGGTEAARITTGGNFGIGTTTPFRKLSVTNAVSTAQAALAYDTTRYTDLLTDSNGDLTLNSSGNDIFTNDENLWVCNGTCSGTPSGTGNLIVETSVGVASSTPWAGLSVASGKAIVVGENTLATSTSMTIDWRNGNQQLVRIGTAAVAISFSGYVDGQKLTLMVCNPASGTAGAISFSTQVLWPGGTAPTQTTTVNKCDVWSFLATQATSTLKILGSQTANF